MRGWVIAVLLSFLFVSPATPQCNYQLQYSGPFRASYFDLAIDGSDLWVATGYGVQVFDRTVDPPRLIDVMAIPALTRVVRASGSIAYAGSGSAIYVIRKTGNSLQLIRSLDAGGTVNDLALRSDGLFAATSNGIAAFSITDPANPLGGLTQAPTSERNVVSVTATANELFAADNDGSVEVFTRIGATLSPRTAFAGLLRTTSVRAVGTNLYLSDGQRSAIYAIATLSKIVDLAFGTNSIVDAGGGLIYAAGSDRQLHVLDITALGQPIELFETEVSPSGGTVNRIAALAVGSNRLFIAGGDTGLQALDLSSFAPPYRMRSYPFGAKTSIASTQGNVFTGDSGTGISQFTRAADGRLTLSRRWSDQSNAVHDASGDILLTSTGSILRSWTLTPATPTVTSTATLRSGVRAAVLIGTTAYALLDDVTLWSVDLSQPTPTPVRVMSSAGPLSFLARSSQGFAIAEITEEGTTKIHYTGNIQTDALPTTVIVPGAATALAMNDRRVAVYTFRGINVIDFGQSPAEVTVLPQSNIGVVTDMSIAGDRLADLSGESVRVWSLSTSSVLRQFTLPASGIAVDLAADGSLAAVPTLSGVVSLNVQTASKQPELLANFAGNEYYRKAVASTRFLYLFDGRDVAIFETTGNAPRQIGVVEGVGLIDAAASDSMLFTLSHSGVIAAYDADGTLRRTTTLAEGADAVPSAVAAVRGAPWVSLTKGCVTTGCEKKTIIYDPQSLVPTATLSGAAIDVTMTGTRAYALFDLPKELRVYDVTDALHPSQVAMRTSEGEAASVAASGGVVYALGDKLYGYSDPALTKVSERFQTQTPTSSTRLLIDSSCAIVTGRSSAAEGYSPQWNLVRTFDLPAAARSIVRQNGRIVILTDYSVEIWGTAPLKVGKRRGV